MYSKKVNKDKFYTNPEVVKDLLSHINFSIYDLVIEPSAGNGSFSNQICHNNLIALDLEPEHEDIIKMDWFDFQLNSGYDKICVVGNPPFGINNKLSKLFILKAIEIGAFDICFVLPNVYSKPTLQKIFPKEYRLSKVVELPRNSFLINNEVYHVPCSFYVWSRSKMCGVGQKCVDLRFNPDDYKTDDFEFISKNTANNNDFFIFGANPNNILEVNDVNKNNRGYYIRPKDKNKEELVKIFKDITFNALSSASGNVAWRSKPEIIKDYLKYFD